MLVRTDDVTVLDAPFSIAPPAAYHAQCLLASVQIAVSCSLEIGSPKDSVSLEEQVSIEEIVVVYT